MPIGIWNRWLDHRVGMSDESLFREVMQGVVPLAEHGRAEIDKARPLAIARQFMRDEACVPADSLSDPIHWDDGQESGEELVFLRTGMQRDTLRKLRRGAWVLQAELDLHGMTSVEARQAVAVFLASCVQQDRRCVRIIHGKGLGSRKRLGVLRSKIGHWLAQRDEVLAYCQARPADGGSGAVVVLLKSAGNRRA